MTALDPRRAGAGTGTDATYTDAAPDAPMAASSAVATLTVAARATFAH
jgi:hypothetical protein